MTGLSRWIALFCGACVGAVATVLLLIWAMNGFVSLRSIGLSGNVLIALILGIVLSTGLGVGLMGLVFYSDRSARDELVYKELGREPGDEAPAGPGEDPSRNPEN